MSAQFLNNLNATYTTGLYFVEQIGGPELLTLRTLVWSVVISLLSFFWYHLFWKPFDWFRVSDGLFSHLNLVAGVVNCNL